MLSFEIRANGQSHLFRITSHRLYVAIDAINLSLFESSPRPTSRFTSRDDQVTSSSPAPSSPDTCLQIRPLCCSQSMLGAAIFAAFLCDEYLSSLYLLHPAIASRHPYPSPPGHFAVTCYSQLIGYVGELGPIHIFAFSW
jgi:hypothetical protein